MWVRGQLNASDVPFTGGGGTAAAVGLSKRPESHRDRMRLHFHAAPFLIGTAHSAERCQLCGDRQIDSIVGASFESDCKSHSTASLGIERYFVLFVCVSERTHAPIALCSFI
jgi:hypothetical protein